MRPGRNDPCPCGSGRKFKRCCITQDDPTPEPPRFVAQVVPVRESPRDVPLTASERVVADALRAELQTFPDAIREALLGKTTPLDGSPSEVRLARAARLIASPAALDAKLAAMDEGERLVCRLLSLRHFTRGDLVRLLTLRGIADPAVAVSSAGQQFPIFWAEGPRAELHRLRTLQVVADAMTARTRTVCDVRWTIDETAHASRATTASLWLALVCAPGAVLRARPRTNVDGTLNGAALAKLARTLPHAADAIAAWMAAGAVRRADVAEVDLDRVCACAAVPGSLARKVIERGRSWSVSRLLDVARAAPRGAHVSLGDALIALATAPLTSSDDVESLFHALQSGALETSWLIVDRTRDRLVLPPDLHALLAGDPLGEAHPRSLVQASYEVLLSPSSPFAAATIVALAAEIVHVDAVARLRLTRESVHAACAAGLSGDDLLAALRVVAGDRGVPNVVETAIREWSGSVTVARMGSHVVFELDPSSPALERAAELLAPILVRRAAPHVLLLERTPDRAMLAALTKLGVVVSSTHAPSEAAPPIVHAPPSVPLSRASLRVRDLTPFLTPEWASRTSEAALSHANVRSVPLDPPPRAAKSARRKASPVPVLRALIGLRLKWSWRADWLAELDRLVDSDGFAAAIAASPERLAELITKADAPQRLQLAVAQVAAGARHHSSSTSS